MQIPPVIDISSSLAEPPTAHLGISATTGYLARKRHAQVQAIGLKYGDG
jgi:hypothetical protein